MSEWRRRGGVLAVVLCALFAFGGALGGEFVYDDIPTVRDNQALRSLDNLGRFFWDTRAFSSLDSRMYRPVLLTSLAFDWWLGGGAVWVFKLTNLLVHVAAALALRALLLRSHVATGVASLTACLFAAHPLASEAVNTISGRSELLCVLGLLLGLLAHLRARDDLRFAAATGVCAALACGSKEIGVLLPALALLVDPPRAWRGPALWRWAVRHAPAALVVLGYLAVRRALFGIVVAPLPPLTGGVEVMIGGGRDLLTHACTMLTVLPRAVAQCVLPLGLTLDPDIEFVRSVDWRVLCGAGFLLGVTWCGWRRIPGDAPRTVLRRLGLTATWLVAAPWVVLPLNAPYLEHRMYGPLAALAMVVAAALCRPVAKRFAGVVLLGFVVLSALRTGDYCDSLQLWQRTVERQPASARAWCGVAAQRIQRGELAEALPSVHRAIAIWPTNPNALSDLVELHLRLEREGGNVLVALVLADRLLMLQPRNPFHRLLACRALAAAADVADYPAWYDEAEEQALHCLKIAPPRGLVFRTAAAARTRQGDHERALALLDRSIAEGHTHVSVLVDRVACLRRLGRTAEADRQLRAALQQDPFAPELAALLATPPR